MNAARKERGQVLFGISTAISFEPGCTAEAMPLDHSLGMLWIANTLCDDGAVEVQWVLRTLGNVKRSNEKHVGVCLLLEDEVRNK